jgi:mannitol/fructose-specific phosphotransferase system IIA component (Ntr-type)
MIMSRRTADWGMLDKMHRSRVLITVALFFGLAVGCGGFDEDELTGYVHPSRMQFRDFVIAEAIQSDLDSVDKESVIEEMVDGLIQSGHLPQDCKNGVIQAIMEREELGSTGIGRGVAVPHTANPSVDRVVGTVGVSAEGVEFGSLDGQKVHVFFMLIFGVHLLHGYLQRTVATTNRIPFRS